MLILAIPYSTAQSYDLQGSYFDTKNNEVQINSYSGNYFLLDAFATWCSPCKFQMINLQDVYDVANEQIQMLSLSIDVVTDTVDKVKSYKEFYEAEWNFGLDDSTINDTLEVIFYPTTFIIDPTGKILKKWIGIIESNEILTELDKYLDIPGDLGRQIVFQDLVKTLFSGINFFIFIGLLWILIIYSGFRLIKIYTQKRQGKSK